MFLNAPVSSVHQVLVFRWKAAKGNKRENRTEERKSENTRKPNECKTKFIEIYYRSVLFCFFSIRVLFSGSFPGELLPRRTASSIVRFKPLKKKTTTKTKQNNRDNLYILFDVIIREDILRVA